MKQTSGKVFLVGAGPGDPDLLTLKGKKCLEAADVVLYDQLVNPELLNYACRAELIFVGKQARKRGVDQRTIEALLVHYAHQGKTVVRLKGGDPFVFGRGGEEAEALRRAGLLCEIVPGISSAIAAPAYAGIPVTHRAYASSVAIVSGHRSSETAGKADWAALANGVDTLIILMGVKNLAHIMNRLVDAGCEPERPAAVIGSATHPSQRTVIGTVGTIGQLVARQPIHTPAVIVVGEVVRLGETLSWYEKLVAPTVLECAVNEGAVSLRGTRNRPRICSANGHPAD
jgi:uroporphyrin-III C-methyltransferase